jgi:glyoxylase-like metal-dependent hydrolase (beta-lactamase superfamily II)
MEPDHRIEDLGGDVARLRIGFVNVYFAGSPRTATAGEATATPWALVDAGLSAGTTRILDVAAERFGPESRPAAIVLTHGHFDHIGALEPLLAIWNVPVYAHPLELPFLTGRADYPPADPSVGRGLLARLSPLYPRRGRDLGELLRPYPANGEVPGMPGWRWVHTPGHTPGHVSLFRDSDRFLIAGDAVVTTRQESIYAVLTQEQELNGPPRYFTIDWEKARRSVATLAALHPHTLATGHGPSMEGPLVSEELGRLAQEFDRRARPKRGRYVQQPAVTDTSGVISFPPRPSNGVRWGTLTGVAAAAFASTWLVRRFSRRSGRT